MLESLHLKNVGPAQELHVQWAQRLNLITGDNGMGKSFLLDVAWWALTRTWAGPVAQPLNGGPATMDYVVKGKTGRTHKVGSTYSRENGSWSLPQARPVMPGIVVYVRIDGGFSVWDPARNYWRTDPQRPAAYHFASQDVWDGLDVNGRRVCEGLERDWVSWQEARKEQFRALEEALRVLSPAAEPMRAGPPRRVFIGEGRDRPTLQIGNNNIPVVLASAGVRRMLALTYFLVWAWYEHRVAADLLGKEPESRFVILFDEPETHLHPRWQRTLLPTLLTAIDQLRGSHGEEPQVLVATHSPLVAASMEPIFDPQQDDLLHLQAAERGVSISQGHWAAQGDATSWLVSDTFGLEQARSVEAERAIEAAEAFMRGEKNLPTGLDSQAAIHSALQRLLPAHDTFWPRWLVKSGTLPAPPARKA
jgi:AAA domain, putative AbiEii toxin, Type IV TA system/AAA domain